MSYYKTPVLKATRQEMENLCPNRMHIFTDGSCFPNPGPGGWGVVMMFRHHYKEMFGSQENTTNNEMELMAIYEAIQAINSDKIPITIYSDSQYSIHCVSSWFPKWKANGWRNSKGQPVANAELIQKIVEANTYKTTFKWVKGHVGHRHNERANDLAGQGRALLL